MNSDWLAAANFERMHEIVSASSISSNTAGRPPT